MSIDGYIDDSKDERLLLSNDEDFDRVDEVRASCDAILVGAGTVRRDDPRLLIRSAKRRAARVEAGLPPNPLRVVMTRSGDLDPDARVFAGEDAETLVYRGSGASPITSVTPESVARDLHERGVRRLLVEGGSSILAQFLDAGIADELHLVVAPFFVGDPHAPRLVGPSTVDRPLELVEVRGIGEVVLIRYRVRGGTSLS